MKKEYDKSITLICTTCGDSNFEYNEDKSWIKCKRCEREYNGGYEELVELNQERIDNQIDSIKDEVKKDLQKDLNNMLKKVFKGNKNIKIR